MFFWEMVDVSDSERALLFRRNRLVKVLDPGRHRLETITGNIHIERYDIAQGVFNSSRAKFLLNTHAEALKPHLEGFEMADNQVGLFYRDSHLVDVLMPGDFLAVWKGIERSRVEIIDISKDYSIDEKLVGLLCRGLKIGKSKNALSAIQYAEIPDEHVGLLIVNGKLEKTLHPGSYGYWKCNRSISIKLLDI